MNLDLDISGSGGKGGGGGFSEAANTLQSLSLIRVIEAISEGPIVGLVTQDARSIYLDDIPVQNSDGSYNFNAITYDYRIGLPDQSYMAGFPSAEAVVSLGTKITFDNPVVNSVSNATVDAVRITLNLPNGLSHNQTNSSQLNGHTVDIAVDRRVSGSDLWETVINHTIRGKTMSAYELDFRVERPTGVPALWDFRVRRTSPETGSAVDRDEIRLARFTEIKDIQEKYNFTAYVGLSVDAQATGGTVPTRSYLAKGIILSVPSNYDPVTRQYVGIWDGTFKYEFSDNPAWVLYDILVNERYGMGEFVKPYMIDKFSFYNAAVYNDQLVSDGRGGTEPRFRFNTPITTQEEGIKVLQLIAGVMHATLMYSGGLIWINQDRPSDPVKLVTKANVIDGKFTYSSTTIQQRHTVARVSYLDKNDRYLPAMTTVENTAGINRYGYLTTDVAAYGAVTEGQAIRHGRWILDTNLTITEFVSYKSSINQFDLRVGDVIKLFDEDYTMTAGAGRLVSAGSSTFQLDREVTLGANATIDVLSNDGKTFNTYHIAESNVTTSVVTTVETFTSFPANFNDYIVTSIAAPRLFRISNIKNDDQNIVAVQGMLYDPTKYDRIETGFTASTPNPITDVSKMGVDTPINITVNEAVYHPTPTTAGIELLISWKSNAPQFELKYRLNKEADTSQQNTIKAVAVKSGAAVGNWITVTTGNPSFDLLNVQVGEVYEFMLYAVNAFGVKSKAAGFNHLVIGPDRATTDSKVTGHDYHWNGRDCKISWNYNSSVNSYEFGSEPNGADDGNLDPTFKDYEIKIFSADGTWRRTEYVTTNTYTYTYDKNFEDGITRHLQIEVRQRDIFNAYGPVSFLECSNPTPQIIHVGTTSTHDTITFNYTHNGDPDFQGVRIYLSDNANLVQNLDESVLVYDGPDTKIPISNLMFATSYVYRVMIYDAFGLTDVIATPAATVNTTFLDVNAIAEGVLSGSLLVPDLQARIDLVDSAESVIGSVNNRLKNLSDSIIGTMSDEITAAVGAETTARISGDDAITDQVNIALSRIGDAEAAIQTESSTRATADSANATQISNIAARLDYGGDISNSISGINTQINSINVSLSGKASVSSVNTLSTTVNGNTTSIQTATTSIDGIQAKNTIKIDNNGYVSGYGLISSANNGTPTSEFIVNVDKFAVIKPGYPGVYPFTIGTVGGQTKTMISSAVIGDASINNVMIGTAAVSTLKIGSNSVVVPGYVQGSGGSYAPGSYTPNKLNLSLNFAANTPVVVLVSIEASNPDGATNCRATVHIDSALVFDSASSIADGFTTTCTFMGYTTATAGFHTFTLGLGNNWTSGGPWAGNKYSMLVMGVMR